MRFLGLLFVITFLGAPLARAEYEKGEPLLYLAGSPTADTLRGGEIELGPPWGGWVAGGIGDHITVGWDYPAALAGIPAFMMRAGVNPKGPFNFSIEGYFANWGSSFLDRRNNNFLVEHRGVSGWAHALLAWRLSDHFRLHFYGGANYANYESYEQNTGASFLTNRFQYAVSPDFGLTFEFDLTNWLIFSANAMEGNSFYYVDQISRKYMVLYSFDLAPFSKNAIGILRTFRLELSAIWAWIPPANNFYTSVGLPIFPSMYWQFQL